MSVCSKILEIKKRVSESDIGYRMASGAFWSFTGTALAKAVVVIAGILCARVLGKEIYGQYGLVKSIITTFMVIGGSGLGFTATKYIAEYRREHKERIASIYFVTNGFAGVMAILVSLLLYIFSDFLATTVLHTPPFAYTLRLASFILIVVVVNLAQEGVLSGFEDFRGKAISSFIGSLVQAIGLLSFAYFWGLNGAVIGNGLGLCSIAIINKFFINKDFKIHSINRSIKNVHKEDWKLLYRFSLPAAMSSMIIAPTFFLLRVLIKRYADFSAMADYDVGDQWKLFVLFIPSSICAIVLPILSSFKSSEKQKFWKVLHANLLINGLITVVVALVVILCSGYITSFYGKEFNNPIPLIILSISCVFAAMASVTGSSIASLGRMWTSCLINFQWTILLLGIAYFLMRMGLGTTGASLAVLISYMEILMVQYSYLRITHHKSNK